MANIVIPNSFTASTLIKSADVNANNAEIQSKFNTYAVQTDVAKTITASHTFTPNQTFNGGIVVTGASTTGTINGQTVTSAANFTGSVTVANGLTVNAGAISGLQLALSGNQLNEFFTNANAAIAVNYSGYAGGTTQSRDLTVYDGKNVAVVSVVGSTKSTTLAGPLTVQSGGATVTAGGLTVSAGGATITGNSSVTGTLNVTGAITGAGIGFVNPSAQTSDLTNTTTTPANSALTVALGASQTWKIDCDVNVACNNTGGLQLTLAVPAGATGRIGAIYAQGGVTSLASLTQATLATGGFNTFNGSSFARLSFYVTTAGTAGAATLQLAAGTATQTATLYAGSTMLATRIS